MDCKILKRRRNGITDRNSISQVTNVQFLTKNIGDHLLLKDNIRLMVLQSLDCQISPLAIHPQLLDADGQTQPALSAHG